MDRNEVDEIAEAVKILQSKADAEQLVQSLKGLTDEQIAALPFETLEQLATAAHHTQGVLVNEFCRRTKQ